MLVLGGCLFNPSLRHYRGEIGQKEIDFEEGGGGQEIAQRTST